MPSLNEWPFKVKHCMIFQMKPCIRKLQQRTATAFITLISGRKNISSKTQLSRAVVHFNERLVVRINERSSRFLRSFVAIPAIHFIHHARPISIPKAKVLLLALHVHDSCFKMLAKKIFCPQT